jgi:hypothetical protein
MTPRWGMAAQMPGTVAVAAGAGWAIDTTGIGDGPRKAAGSAL